MDPHQAWLLIRGLRTMPLRLKQHGANGKRVAAYLEKHPKVKQVFYPGSETFAQKELFAKYLSGTNGLMSVELFGGVDAVRKFVDHLHYFQHGCSWGGFESLVATSRADDDGLKFGMPPYLVRLHVGLEDVDTLIADLEQALDSIN